MSCLSILLYSKLEHFKYFGKSQADGISLVVWHLAMGTSIVNKGLGFESPIKEVFRREIWFSTAEGELISLYYYLKISI